MSLTARFNTTSLYNHISASTPTTYTHQLPAQYPHLTPSPALPPYPIPFLPSHFQHLQPTTTTKHDSTNNVPPNSANSSNLPTPPRPPRPRKAPLSQTEIQTAPHTSNHHHKEETHNYPSRTRILPPQTPSTSHHPNYPPHLLARRRGQHRRRRLRSANRASVPKTQEASEASKNILIGERELESDREDQDQHGE